MISQHLRNLSLTHTGIDASDPRAPNESVIKPRALISILVGVILTAGTYGCGGAKPRQSLDACALALAPQSGDDAIDREIVRLQETARVSPDQSRVLEQLGW